VHRSNKTSLEMQKLWFSLYKKRFTSVVLKFNKKLIKVVVLRIWGSGERITSKKVLNGTYLKVIRKATPMTLIKWNIRYT